MSVTGRLARDKLPAARKAIVLAEGANARQETRVEKLRRLVASDRYRVAPRRLALSILTRALGKPSR